MVEYEREIEKKSKEYLIKALMHRLDYLKENNPEPYDQVVNLCSKEEELTIDERIAVLTAIEGDNETVKLMALGMQYNALLPQELILRDMNWGMVGEGLVELAREVVRDYYMAEK